jgi:hypothetical protein
MSAVRPTPEIRRSIVMEYRTNECPLRADIVEKVEN